VIDAHEPDVELMRRVQRGQTEWFAILVRRYQSALTRVARSRLGNLHLAEDIVQETFLSAYKSRHTFNPRYSFRTWLWTILLNRCWAALEQESRQAITSPGAAGATTLAERQPADHPPKVPRNLLPPARNSKARPRRKPSAAAPPATPPRERHRPSSPPRLQASRSFWRAA
jgi:RNA polymerase sigma factor (sigma-70 family)